MKSRIALCLRKGDNVEHIWKQVRSAVAKRKEIDLVISFPFGFVEVHTKRVTEPWKTPTMIQIIFKCRGMKILKNCENEAEARKELNELFRLERNLRKEAYVSPAEEQVQQKQAV